MIKTGVSIFFILTVILIMAGNIKFLIVKINNFTDSDIGIDFCVTNKCKPFYLKPKDYALKIILPERTNTSESISVHMNVLFNGQHINYKDIGYFIPESIFINNTEEICFYQNSSELLLKLCP